MAKVFGGGSSCGDKGAQRVLPTSSEAIQANPNQTFSTQPNVYAKPSPTADGIDIRDFYTKTEINKFLKTKANIADVYDKGEVDSLLQGLQADINSSISTFVTETELNTELISLSQSIMSDVQSNYYTKSVTYTKYEIDDLISDISIGTDDFVLRNPTTTSQNVINPGSNNAVPLTIRASTSPTIDTIQHWIDDESNSVGRIRTSGQVEFYGNLDVGTNVPEWLPAISVNDRRIAEVADPVELFDAVNKKYVEDYITELINAIARGDVKVEFYLIDAQEY